MNPAEGAVTAAAFYAPPGSYAPTHLLTGSADGAVCVWAAGGGWEAMKAMRGHRCAHSAAACRRRRRRRQCSAPPSARRLLAPLTAACLRPGCAERRSPASRCTPRAS